MTGAKRVLMVAPTPYFSDRGCHVQIYEVARSQQRNGNDVQIVTYHLGRNLGDIPTHRIPPISWYTKRGPGPSLHKFYLDVMLMTRTLQVARQYRPHVIHAHLHEGAGVALPLARALGVPIVLDLQGSLTGELVNHSFIKEGSSMHRMVRFVEEQIHHHVDAMLMWTYIGESLRSLFRFDAHKVFNVDYGVDLEAFQRHPKHELDDLYQQLQLPRDRKMVVYLGVMNAYQGIDLLLESIPQVLARVPDAHFLLMGYPDEQIYRDQVRERGFADRVTIPGRIDYTQAARYLSLGDVAVSPKLTRMEGNGKLLNYLACGLPAVAFDLPGNLATLGDVGTFAPAGDATAFANAIIGLLQDETRRVRLATASRARAEKHYSWQAIGKTIDAVYDEVLARRVRARRFLPRSTATSYSADPVPVRKD